MADITMCKWEWCNKKENCYRFTAKADPYRQSYFMSSPIKEWKCEHFIDNK